MLDYSIKSLFTHNVEIELERAQRDLRSVHIGDDGRYKPLYMFNFPDGRYNDLDRAVSHMNTYMTRSIGRGVMSSLPVEVLKRTGNDNAVRNFISNTMFLETDAFEFMKILMIAKCQSENSGNPTSCMADENMKKKLGSLAERQKKYINDLKNYLKVLFSCVLGLCGRNPCHDVMFHGQNTFRCDCRPPTYGRLCHQNGQTGDVTFNVYLHLCNKNNAGTSAKLTLSVDNGNGQKVGVTLKEVPGKLRGDDLEKNTGVRYEHLTWKQYNFGQDFRSATKYLNVEGGGMNGGACFDKIAIGFYNTAENQALKGKGCLWQGEQGFWKNRGATKIWGNWNCYDCFTRAGKKNRLCKQLGIFSWRKENNIV